MAKTLDILLVEDSLADATLAQEALIDAGISSRLNVVTDGEEALDYLTKKGKYRQSQTPDVILLDLNMPKKNGHEVLAEVRQDAQLVDIPIIVLTVSSAESDISEALDLGMNYYLPKPVDAKRLGALLVLISDMWEGRTQDTGIDQTKTKSGCV